MRTKKSCSNVGKYTLGFERLLVRSEFILEYFAYRFIDWIGLARHFRLARSPRCLAMKNVARRRSNYEVNAKPAQNSCATLRYCLPALSSADFPPMNVIRKRHFGAKGTPILVKRSLPLNKVMPACCYCYCYCSQLIHHHQELKYILMPRKIKLASNYIAQSVIRAPKHCSGLPKT